MSGKVHFQRSMDGTLKVYVPERPACAYTITSSFSVKPEEAAIVNDPRPDTNASYWCRILHYCLKHDLQGVLDEYVGTGQRQGDYSEAGCGSGEEHSVPPEACT